MTKRIAFAFWYKGSFEIEDDAGVGAVDRHVQSFMSRNFLNPLNREDGLKIDGFGVEVGPAADYPLVQADTKETP